MVDRGVGQNHSIGLVSDDVFPSIFERFFTSGSKREKSEDQLETDYSSTNCKYLNKLRFIYRMKIMAYKISGQFKIVKRF